MNNQKGLTLIFTGNGKGKTSAALGTAFRALGWGYNVLMIQFMKTLENVGEIKEANKIKGFKIVQMGEGFYKIGENGKSEEVHRKAALTALDYSIKEMSSGKYFLIILDEVINAFSLGLLKEEDVLSLIDKKPDDLHLILTGRGATKKIMDLADLVTEMKEIKHLFQKGIKAVRGLDY